MSFIKAISVLAVSVGVAFAISAGQTDAQTSSAITGYVWYDADFDGNRNEGATAGLANVTLRLTPLGPDGLCGTGDDGASSFFTTGADGSYGFAGLSAGPYRVGVEMNTAPPGLSPTTDCYLDTGCLSYRDVQLGSGQTLQGVNFGLALLGGIAVGTIGDRVWYDMDGDGLQETGEPGIDNVTVAAAGDVDGDQIAEFTRTATTRSIAGVGGLYAFDMLPIGVYTVTVDQLTLPRNLLPSYDFDGVATPNRAVLPLAIQVNSAVDFGYKRCGVEVGNLTVKAREIKWKIANKGIATLTLDRVFVSWPDIAGNLTRIKLGGRTVFIQTLDGPSALVYNWTGDLADRQIKVGREKELKLQFEKDLGRSTAGFVVRVEFAEGCVIEYVGSRSGIAYCDAGRKPEQLTVLYTGETCIASNNNQATDKTSCVDVTVLPATAQSVYVRASDRANPDDGSAKVWFVGTIGLDTPFVLDAANAGEPRLRTTTFIHVFRDLQGSRGALIQQLSFKTDCSQPLNEGDQYGGVVVTDFIPE